MKLEQHSLCCRASPPHGALTEGMRRTIKVHCSDTRLTSPTSVSLSYPLTVLQRRAALAALVFQLTYFPWALLGRATFPGTIKAFHHHQTQTGT